MMLDNLSTDLSTAAARLVEAACSAQAGDCETAKAHIARALEIIHGRPGATPQVVRLTGEATREITPGRLAEWQARRLAAYIEANLTGRVCTKDLAILLGFSTSHFCRTFRCTFGVPPHAYINRRRVEFAQRLMLTTSETLSQIALRCGMSDQSHFTRLFRRMVGETPYLWRRERRATMG
jgi:AraC family transcriptional regulator